VEPGRHLLVALLLYQRRCAGQRAGSQRHRPCFHCPGGCIGHGAALPDALGQLLEGGTNGAHSLKLFLLDFQSQDRPVANRAFCSKLQRTFRHGHRPRCSGVYEQEFLLDAEGPLGSA
jgi:hypothetical protein